MKDIAIMEGATPRQFGGIKRLVTDLSNGRTCAWVPEDERRTKTKSANKNGTYRPSEDDCYGYSRVTVNVRGGSGGSGGSVIGHMPDGNDYEFTVDENGEIVQTKVPSSIAVTTPPNKLSYVSGETLDPTGIVVTAYDGNGESMGEVPFEELVFDPTTITSSGSGDFTYAENDADSADYNGKSLVGPFGYVVLEPGQGEEITIGTSVDGDPVTFKTSNIITSPIIMYCYVRYFAGEQVMSINFASKEQVSGNNVTIKHDGRTVFDFAGSMGELSGASSPTYGLSLTGSGTGFPVGKIASVIAPTCGPATGEHSGYEAALAEYLLYGEGFTEHGGGCDVLVQWPIPNSATLTTSMHLNVTRDYTTDPGSGSWSGSGGGTF